MGLINNRISIVLTVLSVAIYSTQSRAKSPEKTSESTQSKTLKIGTEGNSLAFNPKTLSVKANQQVTLIFSNNATSDSGMFHNWVLVNPEKDSEIANSGVQAGSEHHYIIDSPDIIAHTRIVDPGKSETIHFTAPQSPGDYPFICTVPGHYPSLKGTLKVSK